MRDYSSSIRNLFKEQKVKKEPKPLDYNSHLIKNLFETPNSVDQAVAQFKKLYLQSQKNKRKNIKQEITNKLIEKGKRVHAKKLSNIKNDLIITAKERTKPFKS